MRKRYGTKGDLKEMIFFVKENLHIFFNVSPANIISMFFFFTLFKQDKKK